MAGQTSLVGTPSRDAPARTAAVVARRAACAFAEWSLAPASVRRDRVAALAGALESNLDELVAVMREETGIPRDWAVFNCRYSAEWFRDNATLASRMEGRTYPPEEAGILSFSVRQPAGVVLSITPWNAPIILAARAIAAPLACGNAVILKASELCPRTHDLLVDLLNGAGLPDGLLQVVHSEDGRAPEMIEALIAQPVVRRVNFTGSTRAGRFVAESAARHLKKCLLALGSKSAAIVLADCDVGLAADTIARGAFLNHGQLCMSTERVVVEQAVAEPLIAALAERTRRAGAQAAGARGERLVSGAAAGRVVELIEDAVAKGAVLVAGGTRLGDMVAPALIDHVDSSMRVYREECFGPIAYLLRAEDADHAVTLANDTDYGLAASVFSRDFGRALMVARQLETGSCHINGSTVNDHPGMPFGGVKASGYGRFGGESAVEEFTELRWITLPEPQSTAAAFWNGLCPGPEDGDE